MIKLSKSNKGGLKPMRYIYYCNNVKEIRESLSMTQTELALRCDTTQNTISSIEHGQVPSVALALKIARALNIPVTELFNI